MASGGFSDFMNDLLAYESGWDRSRYDRGIITDQQLNTWARGSVRDFFPDYGSWGDLSETEWQQMACRSMNSLGFVGFQFGEALLIDLGYYQDDSYYLNGESENLWDGAWLGQHGVDSLDDFLRYDVQSRAMQEAFGYNLFLLDEMLAGAGLDLADYVNRSLTVRQDGGARVEVELTLTGILAAAHLRGASGLRDLIVEGAVTTDEYGTSILQYIEQFGGYDSPGVSDLVQLWLDPSTDPDPEHDTLICVMKTPGGRNKDSAETPTAQVVSALAEPSSDEFQFHHQAEEPWGLWG